MMDFEEQLRRALVRKDPSADFAARVMARAAQPKRPLAWVNLEVMDGSGNRGVAVFWARWVLKWNIAAKWNKRAKRRALS